MGEEFDNHLQELRRGAVVLACLQLLRVPGYGYGLLEALDGQGSPPTPTRSIRCCTAAGSRGSSPASGTPTRPGRASSTSASSRLAHDPHGRLAPVDGRHRLSATRSTDHDRDPGRNGTSPPPSACRALAGRRPSELSASIMEHRRADRKRCSPRPPNARLNELGDPALLAAGFADRPLHLIGLALPTWWRLLALLLAIVPGVRAGARWPSASRSPGGAGPDHRAVDRGGPVDRAASASGSRWSS